MCDSIDHRPVRSRVQSAGIGKYACRRPAGAFTLVEILIVVMILAILAAIVVPHVSSASHQARENALRDDVRYLRMQIVVYKAQHHELPPAYPTTGATGTPTEALFEQQMTMYTDETGATSATPSNTYKFGPYLSNMPVNPVNHKTTFLIIGNGVAMPAPTGSYGWIYKPETEEILPDVVGSDMSGILYSNY
jgi:prepilin-type N-terminal cleavage/methylation domain-containing protein